MLIDAHLHVWRQTTTYANPTVTAVSPFSDVPLELFKEYMSEYDIARAVLVQPLFPGQDNSYVADCARREPERFAAVCVLDPRDADAPARLGYWVNERGCKGLRIRPRISGEAESFGTPATFPLWERARALGVVVTVLANPEHLLTLSHLVERFPEINIVIDHMAHPDVSAGIHAPAFQTLLALARFPRVAVKVTGYYYYSRETYPYSDCHVFFRALYDAFGPTRLIWGSDFPHVLLKSGYRRNLLLPERAYKFLSASELALIMGDNARALYWK